MASEVPRCFSLPFRFGLDGDLVSVAQDSVEEITDCVEATLRTHPGDRVERPDFGSEPLVPDQQPLDVEGVIAAVETHEPRARMAAEQDPDSMTEAQARLNTTITGEG